MTRSEVYAVIDEFLSRRGLTDGYDIQYRWWRDGDAKKRYIVIQAAGGSGTEEALTRDNFRILVISRQNDTDIGAVEDRAGAVRDAIIDDYNTGCIIQMTPIGGIPSYPTEEGRSLFEINIQTIISR